MKVKFTQVYEIIDLRIKHLKRLEKDNQLKANQLKAHIVKGKIIELEQIKKFIQQCELGVYREPKDID